MQEIYKDIQGFEGYYQVSNLGNVKSTNPYHKKEKGLLAQYNAKSKTAFYKRVTLHKNGEYTRYLVHRLVALHFIENPENKPQVNHIDNDTFNNEVSNLQWVTGAENMKHSRDQGRQDKVTEVAAKAMAEANRARAKLKYDALIGTDINGRKLLSYEPARKPNGKPIYKGLFECMQCHNTFSSDMDSSVRNLNRETPCYCKSCAIKNSKVKI